MSNNKIDFCCETFEHLLSQNNLEFSGLSGQTLLLNLHLWNGFFKDGESVLSSTYVNYCPNCGFKITQSYLENLITKYKLIPPKHWIGNIK